MHIEHRCVKQCFYGEKGNSKVIYQTCLYGESDNSSGECCYRTGFPSEVLYGSKL
jgi:hypothetical protein